jgi:hypothetical protein
MTEARSRRLSGVNLKDEADTPVAVGVTHAENFLIERD